MTKKRINITQSAGLIRHVGSAKMGHWEVVEKQEKQ